jgi:two-component system, OmpR family, phosphate regulon response regulator PhoB
VAKQHICRRIVAEPSPTVHRPDAPNAYGVGPMGKVLVIDDEADLREILRYALVDDGHKVQLAETGAAGINRAFEWVPEVVLLDLMLPDIAGTDVCRILKKDSRTSAARVIMVSAKGEEADRIAGFELGADDYVVKPFSTRELLLRVGAHLRRTKTVSGGNGDSELAFGGIRVERESHRVFAGETEVMLTALEFKLIVLLIERRERVQTRGSLLTDVWGFDSEIETRTVDTHVKRLREKLGALGDYIQTVRGVGYRLSKSKEAP